MAAAYYGYKINLLQSYQLVSFSVVGERQI